jgi:hypothetical protein
VLKNDDLHQLSALLYRNIDLFAKSDLDLPGSNLPPHKFEMDTNRVIHSKQFFLPPGQISELKRQTQNLLDAKIIELHCTTLLVSWFGRVTTPFDILLI